MKIDKKEFKKTLTTLIGTISYDILDNIVCPLAGIGSPLADLYLADINDHTFDEKIDKKVLKKISEKYKVDLEHSGLDAETPLALLALYIIENGKWDIFRTAQKE